MLAFAAMNYVSWLHNFRPKPLNFRLQRIDHCNLLSAMAILTSNLFLYFYLNWNLYIHLYCDLYYHFNLFLFWIDHCIYY